MRNVFCFNGFNQTAIILRYSAILNHVKQLKPLKQKQAVVCGTTNPAPGCHIAKGQKQQFHYFLSR